MQVWALLVVALPLACAWRDEDPITSVSAGPSGVWYVKQTKYGYEVRFVHNQYTREFYRIRGEEMKQVEVGKDIVWAVSKSGDVFIRENVNQWNAQGSHWTAIGGQKMKQVTVSPKGYVWALDDNDKIYKRTGISSSSKTGSGWKLISGSLVQISAGASGVWGVNKQNNVYYRVGTFGDTGSDGPKWQMVEGFTMTQVSSGDGVVAGIREHHGLYKRNGVSSSNPTGSSWVAVSYAFNQVDVYKPNKYWGAARDNIQFISFSQ